MGKIIVTAVTATPTTWAQADLRVDKRQGSFSNIIQENFFSFSSYPGPRGLPVYWGQDVKIPCKTA